MIGLIIDTFGGGCITVTTGFGFWSLAVQCLVPFVMFLT